MSDRRATFADLLDVPEICVGELLGGELHISPRPAPPQALAATVLSALLVGPWSIGRGGPGGWYVLKEPELRLGEDALVPDLVGWRRDVMPVLPTTDWVSTPPAWVCEVLSPAGTLRDRAKKLPIYARHGIPWVWLVDPITRIVEVFRLDAGAWVLHAVHGDDEEVSLPPFEAAPIALGNLWIPQGG